MRLTRLQVSISHITGSSSLVLVRAAEFAPTLFASDTSFHKGHVFLALQARLLPVFRRGQTAQLLCESPTTFLAAEGNDDLLVSLPCASNFAVCNPAVLMLKSSVLIFIFFDVDWTSNTT